MPFTFPDPQTTSEFTGDNGITYSWDVDDSKWQVKTTAALDDIRQDIIELEEEIDAIAPSVERGRWVFTAVGTVANPGQFTMYDADFGSGQPTGLFKSAKSIWFNEIDSDGTLHSFADVDDGELLEIFVDGSPEYGLYEVVGKAHDETQGASSFWVIDVNFVRTLEPTTAVGPGELCRFKVFMAPTGVDASEILKYVDDRLEGVVGRYLLKDVANNPISTDGHMGISTSFAANVKQLRFGAKDLDGGVTKQLTDGDIIETFDAANNRKNRFKVTDASNAPSVVKVEFVSGNSSYSIDDVYQVQIYPGGDASSGSPVMLHSGWDKKYNFKPLGSLNEREMTGTSLLTPGALSTSIYLYRAYKQSGGTMPVLSYDRTEDSMIEVWEWNSGDNIPILRAGIKEIKVSSESQYDAELLLSKFWAKPGYNWSTSRYYTFILHGLVQKPSTSGTTAIPAEKLSNVGEAIALPDDE